MGKPPAKVSFVQSHRLPQIQDYAVSFVYFRTVTLYPTNPVHFCCQGATYVLHLLKARSIYYHNPAPTPRTDPSWPVTWDRGWGESKVERIHAGVFLRERGIGRKTGQHKLSSVLLILGMALSIPASLGLSPKLIQRLYFSDREVFIFKLSSC